MNFSFKKEKEIKVDFSAERICVLKDKILLYGGENVYFIDENGEIIFSISIFGFERGKISEFFDFTTGGNDIFILGRNKVLRYSSYGEFLSEFPINLSQPLFIGVVFPFGIFIFEKPFYRTIRYDFDGKKRGEFYIKNVEIKDMEVDENYIYFYTKEGKILVYNFYGNKVKEFKLIKGKDVEIDKELIFLLSNENLHIFEKDKEIYSERLIADDIYLKDELLYILSKNIKIRRFER